MTDPYRPPEPDEAPEPLPFTPVRALVWMLGGFLVMAIVALLYYAIAPDSAGDLVTLGILSSVAFLLTSSLLVGRYPAGPRLSQALGVRASHPGAIVLGLLLGVTAKLPAEQLSHYIERLMPRPAEDEARLLEMFQAESAVHAAALLVVIALLVPLSEEVFFRGAIYGALRRNKTPEWPALAVTALGFAFCHADLRQLVPILLVAFLLGAIRTLSGSLLPSLAAHIGFNGLAILGATYELFPEVHEMPLGLRWGATGMLPILLGALVFVVGRHPRAQQARYEEMFVAPEESAEGASG